MDEQIVSLVKVGAWLIFGFGLLSIFGKTLNQILREKFLIKPKSESEAVDAMKKLGK